ncbi:hypothetical protein [Deinococcus depolymerans]|uniref:Uncharacterized protein n=1 Tax=Deinococcus depolymerans TaxID=392408 RepID=A0ABN1BYQ1_9DEIO
MRPTFFDSDARRGLTALQGALALTFGRDHPVPLSNGYGPDLRVPEFVAFQNDGGFETAGVWADFSPAAESYLSGLHDFNQNGNGETRRGYIWEADTSTYLGSTAPATVTGGQCVAHFAVPVRLRAGRPYRIAWASQDGPAAGMSGQNNKTAPTYPGFTVGRMYDNYNNRFNPAGTDLPRGNQYGYPTWALLLAGDVQVAGVTGRLGPGALPRSAVPLSLTDGQAYILAAPGGVPELRMKENGVEYALVGTPV